MVIVMVNISLKNLMTINDAYNVVSLHDEINFCCLLPEHIVLGVLNLHNPQVQTCKI